LFKTLHIVIIAFNNQHGHQFVENPIAPNNIRTIVRSSFDGISHIALPQYIVSINDTSSNGVFIKENRHAQYNHVNYNFRYV